MTTFPMNPALLRDLHALRARHLAQRPSAELDEVERGRDAFLLDPGLGPMCYITSGGEVLVDEYGMWGDRGLHAADEDQAIAILVVGARKMRVDGLLDLIPGPPEGACACPWCHGARWAPLHPRLTAEVVCVVCNGRGWADARLMARMEQMRHPPLDRRGAGGGT
jgi:hypothetical protein